MQIIPLLEEYIPEAAGLFILAYQQQRRVTPCLPDKMQEAPQIRRRLQAMVDRSCALAALEDGKIIGYLCWYLAEQFRGTDRKGAYVPEWGHAVLPREKTAIYQLLYRAAGERWSESGCQVHAISVLAQDQAAESAWYWNGFGLTVVDAIRPMQPIQQTSGCELTIRRATATDAAELAEIDHEHCGHYSRSPIFMPTMVGKDADANALFLERPKNRIWLAEDHGKLASFMRFEGYDFDGVASLESEDGVIITGAYTRPAFRRQGAAVAILDAALRDYQANGINYCAVTFESFNPEASSFWLHYFSPVCFSLLRVPEYVAGRSLKT